MEDVGKALSEFVNSVLEPKLGIPNAVEVIGFEAALKLANALKGVQPRERIVYLPKIEPPVWPGVRPWNDPGYTPPIWVADRTAPLVGTTSDRVMFSGGLNAPMGATGYASTPPA